MVTTFDTTAKVLEVTASFANLVWDSKNTLNIYLWRFENVLKSRKYEVWNQNESVILFTKLR